MTLLWQKKGAAKRIGVSEDEYEAHIASGEKWCNGCKEWHSEAAFGPDSSRHDGLAASCQEYRRSQRASKPKVPRTYMRGRSYVAPRDGDKRQARRRVNFLVDMGLLPNQNTVPCADCGNIGIATRHEYDHFKGYGSEHHETVEAVCSTCHHKREKLRV